MLSLRGIFEDHDLEFDAMLFIDQSVEVSNRQIQFLTQELLELIGYRPAIDSITLESPESGTGSGRILIALDAAQHEIACEFHNKYMPTGLVEGVAAMAGEQNDVRLYWENLGSVLIVARLTPARAGAFNARMETVNDQFRFVPVSS